MSRRSLILAAGLGVALSACVRAPEGGPLEFGSGRRFVVSVADSIDDVGRGASVATGSDGAPYIAYFGFPAELQPGQVTPPRPIGAPSLPSVDLTTVKDGIWTRGAAALQAQIANVGVGFGPAVVADVGTMTTQNVNGTATAIGANGTIHVAWAADTGIWYAVNAGSSFTSSQILKLDQPLTVAGPVGAPAVAVDQTGKPWVAYTVTTGLGQQVTVATLDGDRWSTDVAAMVPLVAGGPQPSRTAIAFTGAGTPVVVFGDGKEVRAASPAGGRWTTVTVEPGALGAGLSATTTSDGGVVVCYYGGSEVRVATSPNGASWTVGSVAPAQATGAEPGLSTGVAVGGGSTYVTWYDPAADAVALASGDGQTFTPIATPETAGGSSPPSAAVPDGSTIYLAWYRGQTGDLMLGTYGDTSGLALAVQSPTPPGPPSPPPPPPSQECVKAKNGEVTIVAQGIAFLQTCIEVPAGESFTIHFDNRDAGTMHNVQIFDGTDATGALLFSGEVVTGPVTVDYQVDALDKGEYFFNCVVHPTMTGKVVAK